MDLQALVCMPNVHELHQNKNHSLNMVVAGISMELLKLGVILISCTEVKGGCFKLRLNNKKNPISFK